MKQINAWLSLCAILSAASGCGVGEYERRMQPTLDRLAWAEQFSDISKATYDVPGTTFKLRLPLSFKDKPFTADSPNPNGNNVPSGPDMLQSPLPDLKLPGIRMYVQSFERSNDGVNVPYCCHVAVVDPLPVDPNSETAKPNDAKPATGTPADAKPSDKTDDAPKPEPAKPLDEVLLEQVKAVLPEAELAWEDVVCETPTMNERVTWKRLRVKGEQGIGISTGLRQKGPGSMDLYLREKDGYQVMLLWRMLDRINDKIDLDDIGRRVAGAMTGP